MNRLKILRKDRGLSQKDIADHLGVTQQAYQKYEQGTSEMTGSTINKIADFYGVSTDYLLGRDTAPDPIKQLTNEQLEQKLVEGYFKLPKEYREKFLEGLRQAVIECCPDYTPPGQSPDDNDIMEDIKKGYFPLKNTEQR
ncbi:MAG: helix-turn-helix domain-containing protein [Ruminococcus sp.]|nr:helix-turn-helix domain-containing protein [Ruminococcus sp.]